MVRLFIAGSASSILNVIEYDPKTPTLTDFPQLQNGQVSMQGSRGRGHVRGRGPGDRAGHLGQRRNRAELSMAGPNHDRSITTIVVEQIPEESFEEQHVRNFFSVFGTIEEVTMKPYKRLALVRFDGYHSAKAAYDSPKVIFDNRFVKVYWYKPDAATSSGANGSIPAAGSPTSTGRPPEEAFDKEKFQRDAEAAQKKLEERKALQQKTDAQLAEIEKKQAELAQKREDELRRMKEKLAAKGQSMSSDVMYVDEDEKSGKDKGGADGRKAARKSATTEKYRAQLKALEDEARSLGIDPETSAGDSERGHGRGRGRAGFGRGRGRGSYRGYDVSQGPSSYRGRGGPYRGTVRAGGAYNLDNRPKKVKVEGAYFDDAKDEGLKQYLFVSSSPFRPSPSIMRLSTARCFRRNATRSIMLAGG